MTEEYCGGPNWWDSTPNNTRSARFGGDVSGGSGGGDDIRSSSTSSTATLVNTTRGGVTGYGWLNENSSACTKLDTSSLQLVSLGLSNSPTIEWNQQHILRNSEKTENSFQIMLQEGMGLNPNFQQETGEGVCVGGGAGGVFSNSQLEWRQEKLFPNDQDSPNFKQIGNRGFSLDQQQQQFSPNCNSIESSVTCNSNNTNTTTNNNQGFQLDSSPSSSILQGFMSSDQPNHHQNHREMNYGATNDTTINNYQHNYFGMSPFLRASSPKQQQQLQFMNNAPYWNASSSGIDMNNDIRPSFFSSIQAPPHLSMPTFQEKSKNTMETRDSNSIMKASTSQETNNITKRARNDGATSTLPPFKVRKEKMGDRITTLQQLVSPFGKTDTASVLSEAIDYIKFLHEQVGILSDPYLKSEAPFQQQPSNEKTKVDPDDPKQDFRSRGLCLVPVSSTFPITHEPTVDFWTPTFGGTFR